MGENQQLSRLHYELVHGLLKRGSCPTNLQLSEQMRLSLDEVENGLRALSEIHGLVLHPHICAPWVVHPFSLTPTLNWIEAESRGWWAPCIWCAFGVATLVGGEVFIHTRFAGESETLIVPVLDGIPTGLEDVVVHFAVPPAKAWDNVHQHCAMVLPFRSADLVERWCEQHALPHGKVVPLAQVARLAAAWYGSHAKPDWRKWTVSEAQTIFHDTGLTDEFWDLGARRGKF